MLDRDQPRCPTEIAEVLGVQPRTNSRHLAAVETFDLAERTHGGWITGKADTVEIAKQIGVAGRGALQRQQHSAYREQRAQYVSRRARDRKDEGTLTEDLPRTAGSRASEQAVQDLMEWVSLRKSFSRGQLEQIAERRGEHALHESLTTWVKSQPNGAVRWKSVGTG